MTPTVVNLFGFWFLEIPLAYGLAIPMGFALERRVLLHCDCSNSNRRSKHPSFSARALAASADLISEEIRNLDEHLPAIVQESAIRAQELA